MTEPKLSFRQGLDQKVDELKRVPYPTEWHGQGLVFGLLKTTRLLRGCLEEAAMQLQGEAMEQERQLQTDRSDLKTATRIRAKWKNDSEVSALIARLRALKSRTVVITRTPRQLVQERLLQALEQFYGEHAIRLEFLYHGEPFYHDFLFPEQLHQQQGRRRSSSGGNFDFDFSPSTGVAAAPLPSRTGSDFDLGLFSQPDGEQAPSCGHKLPFIPDKIQEIIRQRVCPAQPIAARAPLPLPVPSSLASPDDSFRLAPLIDPPRCFLCSLIDANLSSLAPPTQDGSA